MTSETEFDYDTDTWDVIKSYFKEIGLVKHQISSYNYFIKHLFPTITKQYNPITVHFRNKFGKTKDPDEKYMGRIMSFFLSMFGLIGVGFIVGGFLDDLIGINITVLISCLIIVSVNLIVLFASKSYRELRI